MISLTRCKLKMGLVHSFYHNYESMKRFIFEIIQYINFYSKGK